MKTLFWYPKKPALLISFFHFQNIFSANSRHIPLFLARKEEFVALASRLDIFKLRSFTSRDLHTSKFLVHVWHYVKTGDFFYFVRIPTHVRVHTAFQKQAVRPCLFVSFTGSLKTSLHIVVFSALHALCFIWNGNWLSVKICIFLFQFSVLNCGAATIGDDLCEFICVLVIFPSLSYPSVVISNIFLLSPSAISWKGNYKIILKTWTYYLINMS